MTELASEKEQLIVELQDKFVNLHEQVRVVRRGRQRLDLLTSIIDGNLPKFSKALWDMSPWRRKVLEADLDPQKTRDMIRRTLTNQQEAPS